MICTCFAFPCCGLLFSASPVQQNILFHRTEWKSIVDFQHMRCAGPGFGLPRGHIPKLGSYLEINALSPLTRVLAHTVCHPQSPFNATGQSSWVKTWGEKRGKTKKNDNKRPHSTLLKGFPIPLSRGVSGCSSRPALGAELWSGESDGRRYRPPRARSTPPAASSPGLHHWAERVEFCSFQLRGFS